MKHGRSLFVVIIFLFFFLEGSAVHQRGDEGEKKGTNVVKTICERCWLLMVVNCKYLLLVLLAKRVGHVEAIELWERYPAVAVGVHLTEERRRKLGSDAELGTDVGLWVSGKRDF